MGTVILRVRWKEDSCSKLDNNKHLHVTLKAGFISPFVKSFGQAAVRNLMPRKIVNISNSPIQHDGVKSQLLVCHEIW